MNLEAGWRRTSELGQSREEGLPLSPSLLSCIQLRSRLLQKFGVFVE